MNLKEAFIDACKEVGKDFIIILVFVMIFLPIILLLYFSNIYYLLLYIPFSILLKTIDNLHNN